MGILGRHPLLGCVFVWSGVWHWLVGPVDAVDDRNEWLAVRLLCWLYRSGGRLGLGLLLLLKKRHSMGSDIRWGVILIQWEVSERFGVVGG